MAINKVEYAGETLIDITDTTATADTVAEGFTAYGADGEKFTGIMQGGGGGSAPYCWKKYDIQPNFIKKSISSTLFTTLQLWNSPLADVTPSLFWSRSFTINENTGKMDLTGDITEIPFEAPSFACDYRGGPQAYWGVGSSENLQYVLQSTNSTGFTLYKNTSSTTGFDIGTTVHFASSSSVVGYLYRVQDNSIRTFIECVSDSNPEKYPLNGTASDGYWYERLDLPMSRMILQKFQCKSAEYGTFTVASAINNIKLPHNLNKLPRYVIAHAETSSIATYVSDYVGVYGNCVYKAQQVGCGFASKYGGNTSSGSVSIASNASLTSYNSWVLTTGSTTYKLAPSQTTYHYLLMG